MKHPCSIFFFRCADVTVKLQLCTEQLSQVSDIMPHIEVCTHVMWLALHQSLHSTLVHFDPTCFTLMSMPCPYHVCSFLKTVVHSLFSGCRWDLSRSMQKSLGSSMRSEVTTPSWPNTRNRCCQSWRNYVDWTGLTASWWWRYGNTSLHWPR